MCKHRWTGHVPFPRRLPSPRQQQDEENQPVCENIDGGGNGGGNEEAKTGTDSGGSTSADGVRVQPPSVVPLLSDEGEEGTKRYW